MIEYLLYADSERQAFIEAAKIVANAYDIEPKWAYEGLKFADADHNKDNCSAVFYYDGQIIVYAGDWFFTCGSCEHCDVDYCNKNYSSTDRDQPICKNYKMLLGHRELSANNPF